MTGVLQVGHKRLSSGVAYVGGEVESHKNGPVKR